MSSKPFLGFVLLTHEKPGQILRLIDRLNFMFDNPPIVCHHDFSKCDLPLDKVPENISFVRPHIKTVWADWSLTEATLKGIELLYKRPDKPKWFVLLSGSDYPVKSAEDIINDYKKSHYDAHISAKKLVKENLKDEIDKAFYFRYHGIRFKYPSIMHLVRALRKKALKIEKGDVIIDSPTYERFFSPFSNQFVCYYGSQWFSATEKTAKYILRFDEEKSKVRRWYKKTHCSDESYFHTILNNSDQLKISDTTWRYIDWSEGGSHPKRLTTQDLPEIIHSKAHFARKFDANNNPELLNQLDDLIGYKV